MQFKIKQIELRVVKKNKTNLVQDFVIFHQLI